MRTRRSWIGRVVAGALALLVAFALAAPVGAQQQAKPPAKPAQPPAQGNVPPQPPQPPPPPAPAGVGPGGMGGGMMAPGAGWRRPMMRQMWLRQGMGWRQPGMMGGMPNAQRLMRMQRRFGASMAGARQRGMANLQAMRRQMMMRQLFRGVQLDEAQRTRVRELNQKFQPQDRDLTTKVREARRGMNQAQAADIVDEAAIRKQSAALAAAEADLAVARARHRSELLGVLTPEQQKTLKERRQNQQQRMRGAQRPQAPAAPAKPIK